MPEKKLKTFFLLENTGACVLVLGLEIVCPRKGSPWTWPRIFLCPWPWPQALLP